jgi:hypothetical protein
MKKDPEPDEPRTCVPKTEAGQVSKVERSTKKSARGDKILRGNSLAEEQKRKLASLLSDFERVRRETGKE